MKKQCCIVCRRPLNDGIIINGRGICKSCEKRVSSLKVNTDFYDYYRDCIRKNIVDPMLKKEEEMICQNYHF